MPFLSIIIIGLIAVLAFQIVSYFQSKNKKELENKAAVQVIAGKAEMKIWGVDQWMTALSGSILNEGDAIRTAPGSRVVLSLLNGRAVRLSSETEVELTGLRSKDMQDEISLNLNKGDVWLRKSSDSAVRAVFKVTTPNLEVNSLGTIFGVENAVHQAVRVMDGKVQVIVKVNDDGGDASKARVVETVDVALGQEVSLGQDDILNLKNGKSVDLLTMVSDDFRDGDWYKWNKSEDLAGNGGMSVADAVEQSKANGKPAENVVVAPKQEEKPPVEVAIAPESPVILTPKPEERTTKTGSVNISGTTSLGTDKIEVNTYLNGKAEPYVLSKYKSGSQTWSYVASSFYGNLVAGENRFTIVAIGRDGRRSDPVDVTIIYDRPKEPADMSAPTIDKINGQAYTGADFETEEDVVSVFGKVGKGISRMYVDDFMLTRYVQDSGAWSYFAKSTYGNLKEGTNVFSVYGVDYDGNKTPVTKFTIVKKTKAEVAPAPVPTPALKPVVPAPEPAL